MGREDKNIFLVVSADKNRVQKITNLLVAKVKASSVFHAADWFDTKYKIDNVKPKIMLIDEFLPKGSGSEIVSKVLREKNNDGISIIIMSAVGDLEQFTFEVQKGRIQYLTSPDSEDSILSIVNRMLNPQLISQGGPQYNLKTLKAGEILFKEGDSPEVVYIVKKGLLRAYSHSPGGAGIIVLGDIKSGEFVGEMGHFNHEPRSATVDAVTDVDLIEIPIHALESVIFANPSWAKALVKTLATRLKKANKALAEVETRVSL